MPPPWVEALFALKVSLTNENDAVAEEEKTSRRRRLPYPRRRLARQVRWTRWCCRWRRLRPGLSDRLRRRFHRWHYFGQGWR